MNRLDAEFQKFVEIGAVGGVGSFAITCLLMGMSGSSYIPIQVTSEGRLIVASGA